MQLWVGVVRAAEVFLRREKNCVAVALADGLTDDSPRTGKSVDKFNKIMCFRTERRQYIHDDQEQRSLR